MKRACLLAPSLLAVLAASCAEVRVHRRSSHVDLAQKHEERYDALAFGLTSLHDPVDLRARCGTHEWDIVTSRKKPLQALLTVVTLNLYSPWTVAVECRESDVQP